jgi:hypothetical protein
LKHNGGTLGCYSSINNKILSSGTITGDPSVKTLITLLTLLLLLLSACSPSVPVSTPTPLPTVTSTPATVLESRSASGSLFAINEIGLGPNGYVSLTNFTDQPVSLGGLALCQGDTCFDLPGVNVPAGSTIRIALGDGVGLENVVVTKAALGGLQPENGEIGLYTGSGAAGPKAMLTYLQWGSTPHQNTEAAIQAGLWLEGAFAPTSAQAKRLYRTEAGLWLFEE